MFNRLAGRVNAPVILVDQQIRWRHMTQEPEAVLSQGGFATIYRSFNLFPSMVGYSICPFEFCSQTRDLISRDNEFPSIMIDDRVLQFLFPDEIEAAVAHEIAHVAHGDYFKNLPMDPMHPARVVIELEADRYSANVMGSITPVINMISKLRYALPNLLGQCGIQIADTRSFVQLVDARIAALNS